MEVDINFIAKKMQVDPYVANRKLRLMKVPRVKRKVKRPEDIGGRLIKNFYKLEDVINFFKQLEIKI